MRISKRTREEAALICAVAASGGVVEPHGGWVTKVYSRIHEALGTRSCSCSLAVLAYLETRDAYPGNWPPEVDAEAESLLRSGWSPGDKP